MGRVDIDLFDDIAYYPHTCAGSSNLGISISELLDACITLGRFDGHNNRRLIDAMKSIIKFCVEDNGNLTCIDDFRFAEPSFKVIGSTVLGMATTKVVAEKQFGVSQLFHLKDSIIFDRDKMKFYYGKHSLIPDFFGLDDNRDPFLFEAKGTSLKKGVSTRKPDKPRMSHAVDQLQSIALVQLANQTRASFHFYKDKGRYFNISNQYAIGVGFDSDNLKVWEVDPESSSENSLIINSYQVIFDYYAAFADLIYGNSTGGVERVRIDDHQFVRNESGGEACLSMDVLQFLRDNEDNREEFSDTYNSILKRLPKKKMVSSDHLLSNDRGETKSRSLQKANEPCLVKYDALEVSADQKDWLLSSTGDDPIDALSGILRDMRAENANNGWIVRKDGIAVRRQPDER